MTPKVLHEYEDACLKLTLQAVELLPGVEITRGASGVPIHPEYGNLDKVVGEVEVAILVCLNRARSGTLALVPVALFETGKVIGAATFSGSLASHLRNTVSEVLALRDGRWVCIGAKRLPSKRFPTLDFFDTIRPVLTADS